jgi:hypothetical protein
MHGEGSFGLAKSVGNSSFAAFQSEAEVAATTSSGPRSPSPSTLTGAPVESTGSYRLGQSDFYVSLEDGTQKVPEIVRPIFFVSIHLTLLFIELRMCSRI